jgi:hypothetical protein
VSDDFFPELRNILDAQWIVIADACALFAGWCPLGDFDGGSYGGPNTVRQYKRVATGEIAVPSEKDFAEMRMFQNKWIESDFDIQLKEPWILYGDGVSHACSVTDAFKVGLGWRDERIDNLYDAAVEAKIIADAFPIRRSHSVSISVTGVTATGEVGQAEIPEPKFQFYLRDKEPKKPIVKLLYRFLKEEHGAGRPKPTAHDFIMWVHVTDPTEPFITIESVGGKVIKYFENSAPDEILEYKRPTISTAIADLTKEK